MRLFSMEINFLQNFVWFSVRIAFALSLQLATCILSVGVYASFKIARARRICVRLSMEAIHFAVGSLFELRTNHSIYPRENVSKKITINSH